MEFDTEPKIFTNVIICSLANFRKLSTKYRNKRVLPDENCPDTWFYYITRLGKVRNYDMLTGMLYDHCIGELSSMMLLTKYSVKV